MVHFQELNHDLINDRVYIAHSIALILPNSVKASQKILCQVHLHKQTRKFFLAKCISISKLWLLCLLPSKLKPLSLHESILIIRILSSRSSLCQLSEATRMVEPLVLALMIRYFSRARENRSVV